MLRRLSVRTRLIAVLAVPLLLLLAVAAPELIERRQAASEAERAGALAEAAGDLAATIDALQSERTSSAALRAGSAEAAASVEADRAVTDASIATSQLALARIASRAPDLEPAAITVSDELRSMRDVRSATDLAASIVPWVDPFAPALDALLDLQEDIGAAVAEAGMGGGLVEVALLARSKEAASTQAAQLAAAGAWGELRGDQVRILTTLRADEEAFRTAYLASAPVGERIERRSAVGAGAATTSGRIVDAVVREESIAALGDLDTWVELAAGRQAVLRAVELDQAADALQATARVGADARQASTAYLALAGGGLLLALGLALLAARSITQPLRRLTAAADHLAGERLPRLVEALRHPSDEDERYLSAAMQAVEVRSDDELGHLATAFNAVQSVAVEVAGQQSALLRKGISDLYVNLARRNQALIERQIQLLDRLEGGEQDPEVLEHLYLLDHLATRMRRNAESLLVLAGAESGTRRARPVPAIDAVRAALSEVEDYHRVEIADLPGATLHGPAVSDVAHILAELIENATSFSPPESTVRIEAVLGAGGYQLTITDRGVGLEPEQLEEMNAILHAPPVTGLALGRSLGCLVAGRLAARHGITVRLRHGDPCGVVAHVVVPTSLLVVDEPSVAPVADPPDEDATSGTAVSDPWLDDWGSPAAAAPQPVDRPRGGASRIEAPQAHAPASLRDTVPTGAHLEAGLLELLDGAGHRPLVEPPVAALLGRAGDAAAVAGRAVARRSPDEVRALLSRYRSGLRAGRDRGGAAEEDPT